jgi:hypothetical protein
MKKKQKIKTWDFRPSTSGSLPKTQKLARSRTHGLKQFEFLYGPETSGSLFVTTLRDACQILWSELSFKEPNSILIYKSKS